MSKTASSKEVSKKDACPCESGSLYGDCCSKRAVKWMRDSDGGYWKKVPISPEFCEAVKQSKRAFKSLFGRAMRPTDRAFPGVYIESLADTRRNTVRALRATNREPEIIYAYMKTGRVAPEPEELTTVEFERYSAAIDEFFQYRKQGVSIEDLIDPYTPERFLTDTLRNVLLICAYFVEEYINTCVLGGGGSTNVAADFAVSVAFVNFVKSLRSVLVLLDNGISYDANYLIRSLLENYLRIKYVYRDPSRAAQILGFDVPESAEEANEPVKPRKPPPFKNLSQSIGELEFFEKLYGELSEISHSQNVTIKHLLDRDGDGFDFLSVNSDFEVSTLLAAHEVCIRTLDCMCEHSSCPKFFKDDLLTALKRSFGAFLSGWLYVSEEEGRQMSRFSTEFIDQLTVRRPSLKTIRKALKPR